MKEDDRAPDQAKHYIPFLKRIPRLDSSPPKEQIQTITERARTFNLSEEVTVSPVRTTGIDLLDRSLDGGLPAGSVVYLSAEPKSMSEVFLYQFSTVRKTYYFTTSRRPKYISQDITDLNFDIKNIVYIDVYSQYYLDQYGEMVDNIGNEYVDREVIDFTEKQLKNIRDAGDEDVNIIFDTFSFYLRLNLNFGKVLRLANLVYETTRGCGGIAYLYVLKGSHPINIENELINLCDTVFDIELERVGERVTNKLSIPKIRGRRASSELIRFKVVDGIRIDTSRDIA